MSAVTADARRDGTTAGAGASLRNACAAEWTKLWSLRSTWWALAVSVGLTGIMTFTLGRSVVDNNTNTLTSDDQGVVSVSGTALGAVDLVQFVPIALAILAMTGEYASGTIRPTLTWVPPRGRVLAAKALVITAVVVPLGLLLGALGTLAAGVALGDWGRFNWADASSDVLSLTVYLVLICVFTLGLATLLRSTAGALTTAFLGLLAAPMLLTGPVVTRPLAQSLPSSAGRTFMGIAEDAPYPGSVGLLVLVAWTAAALLAARYILTRRDA
ncbi:ABC transporter permease subunit [Actinomadura gamaensis]|uniref:ABC transporter permease subunit n=1 Tax=Actinomadura gamaensis TaxID=1763541 RepID=A0ABV9U925_9ACTN